MATNNAKLVEGINAKAEYWQQLENSNATTKKYMCIATYFLTYAKENKENDAARDFYELLAVIKAIYCMQEAHGSLSWNMSEMRNKGRDVLADTIVRHYGKDIFELVLLDGKKF